MGLNAACRRKLQALQHPQIETVDLSNEQSFRTLVVWLENQKTRFYAPEERKAIGAMTSDTWPSALEKYLQDLGAVDTKVEDTEPCRVRVADWLLSYAIGMEYSDRAEKLQKITKAASKKPAAQPNAKKQQTSAPQPSSAPPAQPEAKVEIELDLDTPEFRTAIEQLADTLGLPHDDSAEAMLRVCAATLQQKLSAEALQARAKRQDNSGGARRSTEVPFRLEDYPPGFDTGDAQLNKAAALLRVLYVADLRGLQSAVNALIATMQDYTAHPKTDASLGKVGR